MNNSYLLHCILYDNNDGLTCALMLCSTPHKYTLLRTRPHLSSRCTQAHTLTEHTLTLTTPTHLRGRELRELRPLPLREGTSPSDIISDIMRLDHVAAD